MRRALHLILVILLGFESIAVSFAETPTFSEIEKTTTLSKKAQLFYKTRAEKFFNNNKKAGRLKLLAFHESLYKSLEKAKTPQEKFMYSYIEFLYHSYQQNLSQETSKAQTSTTSTKKGVTNGLSFKNVSPDEMKKAIQEFLNKSKINVQFVDNKEFFSNNCLLVDSVKSTSASDLANILTDIQVWKWRRTKSSDIGARNEGFYSTKNNFFIYIDPKNGNNSIIAWDGTIGVDIDTFSLNFATIDYASDFEYILTTDASGKFNFQLKDLHNANRVCQVTESSSKDFKNLSGVSEFLRLLNNNKAELVKKMASEGFHIELSGLLLAKGLITENDIVDGINLLRKDYGLSPISWNSNIAKAAINHASYLSKIGGSLTVDSHSESSSISGFTGVSPKNRMESAGYSGGYYSEGISPAVNIIHAIHQLLRWPYHREAFLSPLYNQIGFNMSRDAYFVVNFWGSTPSEIKSPIVYPGNNVKLSRWMDFYASECPNPFTNWLKTAMTISAQQDIVKDSIKLKDVTSNTNLEIEFDLKSSGSNAKLFHFQAKWIQLSYGHKYEISYKLVNENSERTSVFYVGDLNQ